MTLREIEAREKEIYREMDDCFDGYGKVIKEMEEKLFNLEAELHDLEEKEKDPDPDYFNVEITVKARGIAIKGRTIDEVRNIIYDSLNTNDLIVLDTVEVEEA